LLEIGVHHVATLERQPPPHLAPSTEAKLRCLYAGRLVGLKGVHLALQACAHARDEGAAVSFTIVGRGPELPRLKQLVETLNLQKQVQFIDWLNRPALDEQYKAHDVLLFPSLHDSSGNVVLESFAHGLPVVCLALGGPGTMVNATNGIKVPAPPQSTAMDVTRDLGQALLRLASSEALRHQLAQGALETARAMTWQAAVANVYTRFEQSHEHALASDANSS
jgi:glycosyltransferase involved in cell wall biosynthesis